MHGVRVRFPQAGTALDVGEQKGQRAGGQRCGRHQTTCSGHRARIVADRGRAGTLPAPARHWVYYGTIKDCTMTSWFAGVTPGLPRKSVHAAYARPLVPIATWV